MSTIQEKVKLRIYGLKNLHRDKSKTQILSKCKLGFNLHHGLVMQDPRLEKKESEQVKPKCLGKCSASSGNQ